MSKDRSVYIKHIYDCICRIEEYTTGGRDEFFSDHKTQDAVIRREIGVREQYFLILETIDL